MLTGTIKNQRWSKLAALLLVLTLVAGFVGFSVVNSVYAQTDEVLISLNGGLGYAVSADDISLLDSFNTRTYSSLNTFGTKRFYSTEGASLEDVLLAGKLTSQNLADAVTIEITTDDNVTAVFSAALLFSNELYYYPNLLDDSDEDKDPVPTIIATASKQGKEDYTNLSTSDSLRLYRGQLSRSDVNNPDFAKWITKINVITPTP